MTRVFDNSTLALMDCQFILPQVGANTYFSTPSWRRKVTIISGNMHRNLHQRLGCYKASKLTVTVFLIPLRKHKKRELQLGLR